MQDMSPISQDHADLIGVWQLLETLTVSLDRIGMYEVFHGAVATQVALRSWIGPALVNDLVVARRRLAQQLEMYDAHMDQYLEDLARTAVAYWDGPATPYVAIFPEQRESTAYEGDSDPV